jgi:hypothetical protein
MSYECGDVEMWRCGDVKMWKPFDFAQGKCGNMIIRESEV